MNLRDVRLPVLKHNVTIGGVSRLWTW